MLITGTTEVVIALMTASMQGYKCECTAAARHVPSVLHSISDCWVSCICVITSMHKQQLRMHVVYCFSATMHLSDGHSQQLAVWQPLAAC